MSDEQKMQDEDRKEMRDSTLALITTKLEEAFDAGAETVRETLIEVLEKMPIGLYLKRDEIIEMIKAANYEQGG